MNAWHKCSDLRDAVPLSKSRGLYLKPVAQLHISVYLPQLKVQAKSVSNAEIVEKLKQRIHPEEFTSIKVSKSTLQFIRFDGEIESKSKLPLVLAYLDNKTIKVPGFNEVLKIRAVEAKPDFPSKYDWDSFFRDAKDMNEMKVGERPDTIYLANLPCKWFTYDSTEEHPSERLMGRIFEQFGEVSRIDIPLLDPFRHHMNSNISGIKQFTFNQNVIFEAYVQFKEYFCFVKAMDAFRGMKLVYMDEKKEAYMASIKVDFDKSKHLSDASVRRRQIVRERLEKKEKENLEKKMKEKEEEEKRLEAERQEQLNRRKQREEKRKQRQIEKLKLKDVDNINEKIAVEEYLLLMAQRKLESIRLLGELINRVKNEKEKELSSGKEKKKHKHDDQTNDDEDPVSKKNKASSESQVDTEKDLRYKLIQKFKKMQERQIAKETTKLKSLVSEATQLSRNAINTSSVSSDTASDNEYHNNRTDDRYRLHDDNDSHYYNTSGNRRTGRRFNRNGRGRNDSHFNKPSDEFQNSRGRFQRGRRAFGRPPYQNSWRGAYHGQYMVPFMDPMLLSYSHEYYKYLQKITRDSKRSRRSSTRSYSRSRSRSYSRSRSRSYTRSYSRSYSRSRSRSRRSYRSSSRSRSQDRSRYSRSVSKRPENVDPTKLPEPAVDTVPESETVKDDKTSTSVKKHKKEKKKHKKSKKKSKDDEKKEAPANA